MLVRLEQRVPASAMARTVLEESLPPDWIDDVSETRRRHRCARELLFSTVVASKVGCSGKPYTTGSEAESSRNAQTVTMTDEGDRIEALEREVRELRQAKEILRKASAYLAMAEQGRRSRTSKPSSTSTATLMGACRPGKVLPIAPSTYDAHGARQTAPAKRSARARSDAAMVGEIRRVFDGSFGASGVRKVWRQRGREGLPVARCTVAPLMGVLGLRGVVRGRKARTAVPDASAACPLDRVNQQVEEPRPHVLLVPDFTSVATWSGFVHGTYFIDVFAHRIVGSRASRSAQTSVVLDALEQAQHPRRPVGPLTRHAHRGVRYVVMQYTERLVEAGIGPSVGDMGDGHDDALVQTIDGLFKAGVIHRRGPWRSFEAVE